MASTPNFATAIDCISSTRLDMARQALCTHNYSAHLFCPLHNAKAWVWSCLSCGQKLWPSAASLHQRIPQPTTSPMARCCKSSFDRSRSLVGYSLWTLVRRATEANYHISKLEMPTKQSASSDCSRLKSKGVV